MRLNPIKLPASASALIPVAERWGIVDDTERTQALDAASLAELKKLAHCLDGMDTTELSEWLTGIESFKDEPSEEYVAITCLTMAIEQAKVRLKGLEQQGASSKL